MTEHKETAIKKTPAKKPAARAHSASVKASRSAHAALAKKDAGSAVMEVASSGVAAPQFAGTLRSVGRRKEATARVWMKETGKGEITVNERAFAHYFPSKILQDFVTAPLRLMGQMDNHDFSVKVEGGGVQGQAEAVRHGLSRVLLKWNIEFRPPLKKAGFLTRDPRAKERKKFGFKSARRAPQWAKR